MKKALKKLAALVLAAAMCVSMGATGFAQENTGYSQMPNNTLATIQREVSNRNETQMQLVSAQVKNFPEDDLQLEVLLFEPKYARSSNRIGVTAVHHWIIKKTGRNVADVYLNANFDIESGQSVKYVEESSSKPSAWVDSFDPAVIVSLSTPKGKNTSRNSVVSCSYKFKYIRERSDKLEVSCDKDANLKVNDADKTT